MKQNGFYLLEAYIARSIYIKEDPELASIGHFHEGMEIVALLEGSIEAFHMGQSRIMQPNEIFFADSFEVHHYRKITPEIRAIVIVLSSQFTRVFRELYAGQTIPVYLTDVEKNTEIIGVMRAWLNEKEKSYMLNLGYSNILLSKFVENYKLEKKEKKRDKGVSVKLLRYVNDNYCENISLAKVAKEIGYTQEYCSKVFSEVVGMSFRNYLNFLRLEKAKEYFSMKTELKMTTTEIIYKCGFSSTATFYRVLKTLTNN
jgi:AraC-like DNA-binding protein